MLRQPLAGLLCRAMRYAIVAALLFWAVVLVGLTVDVEAPPAASGLTIARLPDSVSKVLALRRTFGSYLIPESFERRRTLEIHRGL